MGTAAPNPFALAADLLDPPLSPWRNDPAGWAKERLHESLWSKQQRICESVVVNRRTAVKSCHGSGKSWTAARLICWWIDSHPPGEAFVISTAPTNDQVEAILWREINKAAKKAEPPLPGRILIKEWKIGNELVGYGRKPADTDPHGFQGIHARYVLVILDEACGIPEQLWIATTAIVTNEDCRVLAIGNPDDPSSHFFKVCQPGSGWNVIQIAAKDTPNFTGEVVPIEVSRVLVGQTYLNELAIEVGEGSAIWRAKVDGDFPEDTPDSVVRASKVIQCRHPEQAHSPEELLPVHLGVDVGGSEHGDRTVIRERRGCKAGRVWRIQSDDAAVVADAVLAAIIETGADTVKIDSIGIGWGVAGMLNRWRREKRHDCAIAKVNVGSASSNSKRWPKLRDELWWMGHDLTEAGGWDLSEIDDRTAADLTAPKWSPDASGRIQVEKKDVTKARLGRSPDDGDALLLAFYSGGYGGVWLAALTQMAEGEAEPPEISPTNGDLHPCKKPDCGRLVSAMSIYCCPGCSLADEGGYEIHDDGPLAHSADCDTRHAERSTTPAPVAPAPQPVAPGLGRLDQLQRRR